MSASSSTTAMIEIERLQSQIDANDEEDSPTDTTNPAFPDESPTLPPTPGDGNGPENSDPTPTRPLSPHTQGPSQHAPFGPLTRTPNRPDLHLKSTTTFSNHTTPYNINSSQYFQVTSPQTNAFTSTGPSSPGRASSRIVTTQSISNQRTTNNQSPITTRRYNGHYHRGEVIKGHQVEHNIPTAPPVPHAPAPSMYWSKVKTFGKAPRTLRAHTVNLVGESMYVFGGCDARTCFNLVYVFDADTMYWSKPRILGEPPPPCRAHSSTLVDKKLFIFGGGDGPEYFNDLYIFDTDTLTWSKPSTSGSIPSPRRAHTTAYYNDCIYVFGGGDGARALNDVYVLNVLDLNNLVWRKLELKGRPPISRGYHTSNLVGNKLVVYGGSDGHECFSDVHVLDLEKNAWTQIDVTNSHKRLSHTATQVGSYLFVVCGHDGGRYTSEVQLLNLVTMEWETRKVYGTPPSGRGYHTTVLYDSRLFVFGGYDGHTVFDDVYVLDLSACAYLPQIINFHLPERN